MEVASAIGALIVPTIVIGILIFIHEFGHFIAAKKADIKVEEFAFGFGPKLIGFLATTKGFRINLPFDKSFTLKNIKAKKDAETEYKINIFPIGGYVKMLGEEQSVNDPRSYSAKPIGKRFTVIVAGVVMNALLAAAIFYIVLFNQSFQATIPRLDVFNYHFIGTEVTEKVLISDVVPNSPAEESGLEAFDQVITMNGQEVHTNSELAQIVDDNIGNNISVVVQKHDSSETATYEIFARPNPPEGEGSMGIGMFSVYDLNYAANPVYKILSGFSHSINLLGYSLASFVHLIQRSIATSDIAPVSDNVTGIVGIYSYTNDIVQYGSFIDLLSLVGLLSISLAFMNILPLPALDGGHIFLLVIEKIRGKRLNPKLEEWYLRIGFFFLIFLMIVITVKDVRQFEIFQRLMDIF